MPREFRRILCATDFSERSYGALLYALRFAKLAGAQLIVTHIVHVPGGDLLGDAYTLNFKEAEKRVLGMLRDLHQTRLENYPNCELRVDIGEPAEQILELARERDVDLIVTATHGRSGLAHLIMGSVAEKIIRHAQCPVLVVREGLA